MAIGLCSRTPVRRTSCAILLVTGPLLVGFDLSRHSIPTEEILSGGPEKDGIPALSEPKFVLAKEAAFMAAEDQIVGLLTGGEARAYPIRILNLHEVVNDNVGGKPVAITYCPLTGSAVAFDRRVGESTLSFGVSGKLYQSNVLMYDHQTESLWSQLREEAVTGKQTSAKLQPLPAELTTWADWQARHPETLVLSEDTGYRREYRRDPYAPYRSSPDLMFPIGTRDKRLPAKEWVLGVRINGIARAYPLAALAKRRRVNEQVGGHRIKVDYEPESRRATVTAVDSGQALHAVIAYWFAWSAFHPQTQLWMEKETPHAN